MPFSGRLVCNLLGLWTSACLVAQTAAVTAADDSRNSGRDLGRQAYAVLNQRCGRCHSAGSGESDTPQFDVLDRNDLIRTRGTAAAYAYIVPGEPEKSRLWERALAEGYDMPQDDPESMTAEERQLLQLWIRQGVPFPQPRSVAFQTESAVFQAIRRYLESLPDEDRRSQRFFTLTHLSNNDGVLDYELRLYRAAVAKLVNSLSRQPRLATITLVPGTEESVLAVDLRHIGWTSKSKDLDRWRQMLRRYPYGVTYEHAKSKKLAGHWAEVVRMTGETVSAVRGDWFVFTAAQPPLYHTLLELPTTVADLEKELGFTFLDHFRNSSAGNLLLARAGFAKSNVSSQNRLVERHEIGREGYYWISYDFKPRKARGDLVRFPLGPQFDGHPFARQAFDHDGGEVIFSLPNGLQAYLLVDAKGKRLEDPAPADVVHDSQAVAGTPAVVNGISCMNCHKLGMISQFRDEIRGAGAVGGDAQKLVEGMYPPPDAMRELVDDDAKLFVRALARTIGPFLQVGEDKDLPLEKFPEPIGFVARRYLIDLTPKTAALELGLPGSQRLATAVQGNRSLLKFGLGTFVQSPPGTIKREKWEARDATSLLQDIVLELGLGTPRATIDQ